MSFDLDLKDEHRTRYETVVILRRFIDPSGRQPIRINENGTVRKGKLATHQPKERGDRKN